MKPGTCLVALLFLSLPSFGQGTAREQYGQAEALLKANNPLGAYRLYAALQPTLGASDTLYNAVVWSHLNAATQLQTAALLKEDYAQALQYALAALQLIQANKARFDAKFAERELWMAKNVVVASVGLGQVGEADRYKRLLYRAYEEKALPPGLDQCFNFDFFRVGNKNVWGYEWYPALPDDRFSRSFTKVVYYVYSTHPDGTDNEQLYRLHVLMFHQDSRAAKFDYLLERQQETPDATISGSYYRYTYQKAIDYQKLRQDVAAVATGDLPPDTHRVVPKRK